MTDGLELDFFVLYSSASTLPGGVEQAIYVAGNLFLEALARTRRQRGLPALIVQWGAIAGTGYVAREATNEQLALQGLAPFTCDQALDVLEDLLCYPKAEVIAAGNLQ